jgi:uncharacterized membrane protein YbaN (DUF454 family)
VPDETTPPIEPVAEPRRQLPGWLLFDIGWMCVGLGFIGVFVPGLPTTIFLLVAAWCFFRSNERAHAWLLEHRLLGPYVRDFASGKGMPVRAKVFAIAMMWATCGSSAVFFVRPLWAKAIVLASAAAGTVAVLRVRTTRTEPEDKFVIADEPESGD